MGTTDQLAKAILRIRMLVTEAAGSCMSVVQAHVIGIGPRDNTIRSKWVVVRDLEESLPPDCVVFRCASSCFPQNIQNQHISVKMQHC